MLTFIIGFPVLGVFLQNKQFKVLFYGEPINFYGFPNPTDILQSSNTKGL